MESIYLTEAKYQKDYKVFLAFNTGESGEVDLEQIVYKYHAAKPIREQDNFAKFYLDSWPTLAWECGFDIAPESLYAMLKQPGNSDTTWQGSGLEDLPKKTT